MTGPAPIDIRDLIAQIQARGKSIYYIAKLMRRQYVQVQRMKKYGRCQPYEYQMLLMILDDVSRETVTPCNHHLVQT